MSGHPNGETERDPGLARERTQLAWSRTAISFAAVGAAIIHAEQVVVGAVVIAMSAAIWSIGRLTTHERAEAERGHGLTQRRTVQLVALATTLVALVALALAAFSPAPA